MSYKSVCVAGGGVLGSQIAFQAAYCGFDVTIWLRSEGSIGRTQPKLDHLREVYAETIRKMAAAEGKNMQDWARGIAGQDAFDEAVKIPSVVFVHDMRKLVDDDIIYRLTGIAHKAV